MQAGDIVTWRKAPKPGATIAPLGFTGCKVLEVGHTDEKDRPAAIIEVMGERVPVLVAELHPETNK